MRREEQKEVINNSRSREMIQYVKDNIQYCSLECINKIYDLIEQSTKWDKPLAREMIQYVKDNIQYCSFEYICKIYDLTKRSTKWDKSLAREELEEYTEPNISTEKYNALVQEKSTKILKAILKMSLAELTLTETFIKELIKE